LCWWCKEASSSWCTFSRQPFLSNDLFIWLLFTLL